MELEERRDDVDPLWRKLREEMTVVTAQSSAAGNARHERKIEGARRVNLNVGSQDAHQRDIPTPG